MIKIAPSILSADFANMGKDIEEIIKCGADYIHCDVMDGAFVPNISFGIKMIKDIRKHSSIPLDVHLMIVEPERYIKQFADAGADIINIHYEAVRTDIIEVLKRIRELGCKSAITIKPDTCVKVLEKFLPYVDMILLMSVYPGFGGQKYIEDSTERARKIREMIEKSGYDIDLEIDGGINEQNCKMVKDAGVNVLVAGSSVFNAPDKALAIKNIREN